MDKRVPTVRELRHELIGVAEDVRFGGLSSFDEVCLRTLLYVIDELARIDAAEAQRGMLGRFWRWIGL